MATEDSALEQLKTPPHSREAEQSLLGGLLLDAQTWDQVSDMVTKRFYLPQHRLIFEAIFKLSERGRPLDVLTISEELDVDEAEHAGHCISVRTGGERLEREQCHRLCGNNQRSFSPPATHPYRWEMSENARKPADHSVSEILDEAETKVFKISEDRPTRGGQEAVNHYLKATLDKIEELYASDSEVTGISTGFKKLDQMTAGLQQSDLVIIAGRPSMGKTALAMCFVEACVIKSDKPTCVLNGDAR